MKALKLVVVMWVFFLVGCADKSDELPPEENGVPAGVELTSAIGITDSDGNQYLIGSETVDVENKNPYVLKKSSNGVELWKVYYENTPVNGRSMMITLDDQDVPWVVFGVDGSSTLQNAIQNKMAIVGSFDNAYMDNYGVGDGLEVVMLARLNPANGGLTKATFLAARLETGQTNYLNITSIGFHGDNVAFKVSASAWPPGIGSSYMPFPGITNADRVNNYFKIYYEMDRNLTEIVVANILRQ